MNDLFRKYKVLIICIVLSLSVVVPYWQVQDHEFILYDDNLYVTENRHVQQGLTRESLFWALTATNAGFWHPLTWVSLMLDDQVYGWNAGGYHWTNVLLHLANTILIFLVFFRMTDAARESALVAALFALHPLHVESVAWVSQRKDVLSTVFWLLTMLMYVRYVHRPGIFRYAAVVSFYVMGLMSKPMVVTLPVVLLLLDHWPLRRFPVRFYQSSGTAKFAEVSPLRLIAEKIPLLVLAAGLTGLTFYTEGKIGAMKSFDMYPFDVRAANAIVSYLGYILKTLWPAKLAIVYPHPGMPPVWQVVLSGAVLLSVTAIVIYKIRRYPFLFAGWSWYMLTLVPVIGLVQIGGHGMADRYTYIPLIGLFLAMVWGVKHLTGGWKYERGFFFVCWGVVLSLLFVLSWHQVRYWRDSITLFQHAVRVTEGNYLMYNNLGIAYFQQGKPNEAMACFEKSVRIKPDFADAFNNMGYVAALRGKGEEAIYYYLKALKNKPDSEKAHTNLADALTSQGKLDEAVYHYREALKIRPDDADAHHNLGMALARRQRVKEARYHFREALKIRPDHVGARNSLDLISRKPQIDAPEYKSFDNR
jgi:tetratricopeptide (TPR) repeat protein